jgi:hypothetical protein
MAVSARDLTRALEELIAALDRRVPRVAQAGEAAIARDAAALRAKATDRLAELASRPAVGSSNDGGDLTSAQQVRTRATPFPPCNQSLATHSRCGCETGRDRAGPSVSV